MPTNATQSSVGYLTTDKRLLRHALWTEWKQCCYWCGEVKDFTDTQIDHIIPKESSTEDLKRAKKAFGLTVPFDLHDPANLAPACARCNGPSGKGSKPIDQIPLVGTKLGEAASRRRGVVRRVRDLQAGRRFSGPLVGLAEADLSDSTFRRLYEDHLPGLVQKLAPYAPALVDYVILEEVDSAYDGPVEVTMALDAIGRATVQAVEIMTSADLGSILADVADALLEEVATNMASDIDDVYPYEPSEVGDVEYSHAAVTFRQIEYSYDLGSLVIEAVGELNAEGSAHSSRQDEHGGERLELQGDSSAWGSFSSSISIELDSSEASPGALDLNVVYDSTEY